MCHLSHHRLSTGRDNIAGLINVTVTPCRGHLGPKGICFPVDSMGSMLPSSWRGVLFPWNTDHIKQKDREIPLCWSFPGAKVMVAYIGYPSIQMH